MRRRGGGAGGGRGGQEKQRREEREGRRRARWADKVVELVTKVTSAWEGERRRLEARESRWEDDCIRNILLSSKVPILPFDARNLKNKS